MRRGSNCKRCPHQSMSQREKFGHTHSGSFGSFIWSYTSGYVQCSVTPYAGDGSKVGAGSFSHGVQILWMVCSTQQPSFEDCWTRTGKTSPFPNTSSPRSTLTTFCNLLHFPIAGGLVRGSGGDALAKDDLGARSTSRTKLALRPLARTQALKA